MRNYLTNSNDRWGLDLFGDFFDDFFKPTFYGAKATMMKTDVSESENGYKLSVDMPGYDKKDISLSLENGYLTISAKREEREEDGEKALRRERSMSCSRSYYVGSEITEDDVKAKYENGTLKLEIPKKNKKEIEKKNIQID